MAGSPPSRPRSFQWSSPSRTISEILGEDRNSEGRHKLLLEIARKEHERVREDAERVYREHLQREEERRLLEEKRREEERIRRDEKIAAERIRLNALKAKKVEIPAVLPDLEPPRPTAPVFVPANKASQAAQPLATTAGSTTQSKGLPNGTAEEKTSVPSGQSGPGLFNSQPKPAVTQPAPTTLIAPKTQPAAVCGLTAQRQPNGTVPGPAPAASTVVPQASAAAPVDRYTIIHKNLKTLRKSMLEQAKVNKQLKECMGDMRRSIRKSVGQLTGGPGGVNKPQQTTIMGELRKALANHVGSQLIDPSDFVLEPRNPIPGAQHPQDKLPSLFLYLVNQFAKAAINQFVNEAGARPETADPVGICIASTFSDLEFQWRGASLIDILIAKFRVACPVLFGYRGNEKTERGRQSLGWKKEHGSWVVEQQHMDRMTGLGAGFAAVSLRNFSRVKKDNPYPPRNYWTAMAKIVNTPGPEISSTQCVVLKSMIQNYEQKFLEFYGTAAIAALRTCLFDFPNRVPPENRTAATSALGVLAAQLKKDSGLIL